MASLSHRIVYETAADSLTDPLPAGSQPERGSGARAEAPFWSSLVLSQGLGPQERAQSDWAGSRDLAHRQRQRRAQSMLSPQAMPGQTLISAAVVNSLFM